MNPTTKIIRILPSDNMGSECFSDEEFLPEEIQKRSKSKIQYSYPKRTPQRESHQINDDAQNELPVHPDHLHQCTQVTNENINYKSSLRENRSSKIPGYSLPRYHYTKSDSCDEAKWQVTPKCLNVHHYTQVADEANDSRNRQLTDDSLGSICPSDPSYPDESLKLKWPDS